MNYYECNLPDVASHIPVSNPKHAEFKTVVKAIRDRTAKLNEALAITGFSGDKFQPFAAELFKHHPDRFDAMTAAEIADYVRIVEDGREVRERMEFPNATVLFDTAYAKTKEWECLRLIGLGGSNSEIGGGGKYKSPRETYYEKTATEMKAPVKADPIPLARGHFCEDTVIDTYCRLNNAVRIPESRMFASKTHPHCIADLDGLVKLCTGDLAIFEAKSTIVQNAMAWAGDKVPRGYVSQCHHYAGVLDDDRIVGTIISCMFVQDYAVGDSFFGVAARGEHASAYIKREKLIEEALLDEKELFWHDNIEAGVVPSDAGMPRDEIALTVQLNGYDAEAKPVDYTDDIGFSMMLQEYKKLDLEYSNQKKITEGAEKRRDAVKANIIEMLADKPVGYVRSSDGTVLVVKYEQTKDSTTVDLENLAFGFPDIYAQLEAAEVIKPKPGNRRFNLTEKPEAAWYKQLKSKYKIDPPLV